MKQRSIWRWAMSRLLLVVMVAIPATLTAQDGQDQGGASFAGGRMVRGTVTAVSADHLTLKTEAGEVYQVVVSANTRVTRDRQPMKLTEIKAGDGVGAMGVLDPAAKTLHAVFVGVVDAEQVKKAREGLCKVYITGKITAINMDTLRLTVLRPDGVSQVIGVDESTSFKRGGRGMAALAGESVGTEAGRDSATAGNGVDGESITLADLKTGDSVAGRGAMKNGVFVPTELGVLDATKAAQRRRRGADESGTGAPAGPTGTP